MSKKDKPRPQGDMPEPRPTDLPELLDLEGDRQDRSADAHPTIQSEEDLERVTSDRKPTGLHGLSDEARRQIAPKLKPKKRAA